jgi:transcription termination factor Rho
VQTAAHLVPVGKVQVPVSADTLERSVLESKDRDQLMAIATALGIKAVSRAKKSDLIAKILETTGGGANGTATAPAASSAPVAAPVAAPVSMSEVASAAVPSPVAPDRAADSEAPPRPTSAVAPASAVTPASPSTASPVAAPATAAPAPPAAPAEGAAAASGSATSGPSSPPAAAEVVLGPDGEPLAEWEIELARQGVSTATEPADAPGADGEAGQARDDDGDGEGSRRRRRRRNRNRNRGEDGEGRAEPPRAEGQRSDGRGDRQERGDRGDRGERGERGDHEQGQQEPVRVEGYLDLRDEGYGFVRVNGYLSSRDDVYVSVKQTRQYGLRKGDRVAGLARPGARAKENPALIELTSVNGMDPERVKARPRFEDLTPLFPDEKLRLESAADPANMTARIIDLVSPIGKGQRGIIVSPPKAGKTTIMKTIATSIERNNPEVTLIVLLIDERPEEVTDFRRTIAGEVVASTFDRPSDEHTHVAELVIEKAKRLVEMGKDVVVILDGITRLSRAYNLAAPATGRIMSGGIDAGALYPPKKFFGAARNIEEGGSLTILATALVETNSRMDEAIFEEFKGTGNMELRLDRKLAERRIYPAIDVDASSTRHEELLFDRKQLQMVWKLRRVLSGLAADGNAAPGLELLIDRLKTFRTNDEFLAEIAKQPSM